MKNIVIIVAGGIGSRMDSHMPKQYLEVAGKPILYHTIQSFIKNDDIHGIIVVIGESHKDLYNKTTALIHNNKEKLFAYCMGGNKRADSVYNGLLKAKEYSPTNILIHDGARPFVPDDLIKNVVKTLETESKAVLVGIPVVDTLQYCINNQVERVVDRKNIWQAQTPQAFDFHMILKAYSSIINNVSLNLTDDISAWKEYYKSNDKHHTVKIIMGSDDLFKVTVKDDLKKVANYLTIARKNV